MAIFIDFMGIQREINLRLDEVIKSCGGHPVHCTEFGFSEYLGNEYEAERLADGRILVWSYIDDSDDSVGRILINREEAAYIITEQEFYSLSKEQLSAMYAARSPDQDGADFSDGNFLQTILEKNGGIPLKTFLLERFERLKSAAGIYDKNSGWARTFSPCNFPGCCAMKSLWFENPDEMQVNELMAMTDVRYCTEHKENRSDANLTSDELLLKLKEIQQSPGQYLDESGMRRSQMNLLESVGWVRVERVYRSGRVFFYRLFLTDDGVAHIAKRAAKNHSCIQP